MTMLSHDVTTPVTLAWLFSVGDIEELMGSRRGKCGGNFATSVCRSEGRLELPSIDQGEEFLPLVVRPDNNVLSVQLFKERSPVSVK